MSAVVKLSSKLPGDFEVNGIDQQVEQLIENPKAARIGVVWYDVQKINVDVDTGNEIPVVRIRRFEPLGEADDVSQAIRDAVGEAMEKRTGRTPIPFDIVEITEERWSDTLPEDGEQ